MGSLLKAFGLVGLLLATTLAISSQVSARHLLEAQSSTQQPQSVEESKGYYGGHGYGHGGYGHGHYGGGEHGGHWPPQDVDDQAQYPPQYPTAPYGYGGGHQPPQDVEDQTQYGGTYGGYGGHWPPKGQEKATTTTEEKGN